MVPARNDCKYECHLWSMGVFNLAQTTLGIEVSAELRKPNSDAHQWMKVMEDTTSLLGAVISVINPAVFETGLRFIEAINRDPQLVMKKENLDNLLACWTSPYSSASLMSNRDSPIHRGRSGDFSVHVGDGHRGRWAGFSAWGDSVR